MKSGAGCLLMILFWYFLGILEDGVEKEDAGSSLGWRVLLVVVRSLGGF